MIMDFLRGILKSNQETTTNDTTNSPGFGAQYGQWPGMQPWMNMQGTDPEPVPNALTKLKSLLGERKQTREKPQERPHTRGDSQVREYFGQNIPRSTVPGRLSPQMPRVNPYRDIPIPHPQASPFMMQRNKMVPPGPFGFFGHSNIMGYPPQHRMQNGFPNRGVPGRQVMRQYRGPWF
jgi:hypothetical protein